MVTGAAPGLSWGCCDAGLGALPGAVGPGWGAARFCGEPRPCAAKFGAGWAVGLVGEGSRVVCAAGAGRAGGLGLAVSRLGVLGGSWSSGLGWGSLAFRFPGGPMGLPPARGRAVLVSACPGAGTVGPAPLCPRSPSGCTFWGKRPWSRTRKILWQLGMVLGAPMVISLVAGIAVPVITIGIPIYMGRKVLAGGPAVPVVPLPVEPGSPWPQAWTDAQCSPLPTACPCSTLTPHSPSLQGPSLLPTPTPSTSEGTLSLERWGWGWAKGGGGLGVQGCFPGTPELWWRHCCGCLSLRRWRGCPGSCGCG